MLTETDKMRLKFYSPVSFLRAQENGLIAVESDTLRQGLAKGEIRSWDTGACILYRQLDWDTRYFGFPVYRIVFASYPDEFDQGASQAMAESYRMLVSRLAEQHQRFYVFAELPSEDLLVLQAMSLAGFRLIETRLTFFREDIQHFERAERYPTRVASEADIPTLQDVARRARNAFDRYHADPFFSTSEADEYLATYVANSVRGFSDMVIVPAPDSAEPGAFLTGAFDHRHESACSTKLARIPLTAVAPERRGWNRRLNSELLYWFKDRGTQVVYTTTQSTNRPAIRVLESLDYSFGRGAHILAFGASAKLKRPS
ncbi:MAG: hypothetical protein OER43_01945 [Gammaproteobacteria bacterium]|nr:hypothetical protein [Gammaproteobacteria bacterium]MDH3410934.1 hypothetical protein [Gammaproteobacteria bacterium]